MTNLSTIEPAENCEIDIVSRSTSKKFRWQVAAIGLGTGLVLVLGYVAFQRLATNANASLVEYNKNLSGGFLAIAFTNDQPGFLVLSALDADQVDVRAEQFSNFLAGTYTWVYIETASDQWRHRLRKPQAITIDKSGHIEHALVDVTLSEINRLRDDVDCTRVHPDKKKRCGTPFSDLRRSLSDRPSTSVPDVMSKFLAMHGL